MSDTFAVDVPGVGAFTFRRRTMRDELRIRAEHHTLTGGVEALPDCLKLGAEMVASLSVLTETAPPGWDIEKLDPLSRDDCESLVRVFSAMIDGEVKFRDAISRLPLSTTASQIH